MLIPLLSSLHAIADFVSPRGVPSSSASFVCFSRAQPNKNSSFGQSVGPASNAAVPPESRFRSGGSVPPYPTRNCRLPIFHASFTPRDVIANSRRQIEGSRCTLFPSPTNELMNGNRAVRPSYFDGFSCSSS
jgi:hypothetical protein